ncbi:hypothetical protein L9F63_011290, partial [Diploptera punctata]
RNIAANLTNVENIKVFEIINSCLSETLHKKKFIFYCSVYAGLNPPRFLKIRRSNRNIRQYRLPPTCKLKTLQANALSSRHKISGLPQNIGNNVIRQETPRTK